MCLNKLECMLRVQWVLNETTATSDEVHKYTTVNTHRGPILYAHVFIFCFYESQWKYNEVTGGLRTSHSDIVSNSERLTCVSHYVALFPVLPWRVINAQVAVSTCQSSVNRRVCCLCLRDLTGGWNCSGEAVSLHQQIQRETCRKNTKQCSKIWVT